jgi:hypothetical protein
MDRQVPNVRSRLRESREEALGESALDAIGPLDFLDHPGITIAVLVGAAVFFLVLLPLLGIALELIVLLLILWSGIVGRVLLGRPWIVEAANLDDPGRSRAFAVKGWRGSGRAIEEIAAAISVSGPPEGISEGLSLGSPDPARR